MVEPNSGLLPWDAEPRLRKKDEEPATLLGLGSKGKAPRLPAPLRGLPQPCRAPRALSGRTGTRRGILPDVGKDASMPKDKNTAQVLLAWRSICGFSLTLP